MEINKNNNTFKNIEELIIKENLGNIQSTTWENISFTNFTKAQSITKQNQLNKICTKELLKNIIDNLKNQNNIEQVYKNNSYWINNLSLGNILNYNKFNKKYK